ncbi:MAG: 3-oxoadipate enol-lactonase [Alphaproteobacteria bacterium]|jgi:3-oxoadipate enol-lactonase|nr:3-oxoadipate enol-lactonase [Alphaproteobacteria bacterium]
MTETIAVNGIDIAYRWDGPKGAPVLTLSNSLASSYAMWDMQVPALIPSWRVLRYDTRGHGASGVSEGAYSMDMLARDVIGLWDALGVEKSAFCGLSLGGMTGQQLGIAHGERLTGLVLCDTIAKWPDGVTAIWNGRVRSAQQAGMGPLVEPTLERWFTKTYRERRPAVLDAVAEMIANTPVAGYVGASIGIVKIDFLERLSSISVPTLVIVGADDPATTVEASEAIQSRIPGAELAVVGEAAHLSNVEQPEAFNAALLEFLSRL